MRQIVDDDQTVTLERALDANIRKGLLSDYHIC